MHGRTTLVPSFFLRPAGFGIFLPVLLATGLHAQQNLVVNGGFDSVVVCPDNYGQILLAPPWQDIQGTPDLFHACAGSTLFRTPNPFICNYLPPHNGEGYTGITVYGTREFLGTALSRPLEAGKPYYVRFYAAADEDCQGWPQSYSDAIALMMKRNNDPNGNYEVVVENSGQTIRDTTNWIKISRCYQSKGTEQSLRIGNPHTDAATLFETDEPDYPFPENYLFIDDVFVGTFDPFPDTLLLCEGTPLLLDAAFLEARYQWSTGDTTATLMVSDTGRYRVEAWLDGCYFRENVVVASAAAEAAQPLGDSLLCAEETLVLTAPLPGDYRWSDESTRPYYLVSTPGLYSVTVTNACGEFAYSQQVAEDTCRCRVYAPTVFSPNDDSHNDALALSLGCDRPFEVASFEVYDRWGNRVFSWSNDPFPAWDGMVGGRPAAPGVYVWQLTYYMDRKGERVRLTEQGDVTLLR